MGCVDPGSYLLSRDLSSDYHRRTNVSLPGSGWDRVGPLGCDHQASLCCGQGACPMVKGCCVSGVQASRGSEGTDIREVQEGGMKGRKSRKKGSLRRSHWGEKRAGERERAQLDVSSAWLHTLLYLHLRPINVVVYHAPIGRIHLGRDLALRCFQRLFLPHLATRPCSRLNNRCTSGASDPVLSY